MAPVAGIVVGIGWIVAETRIVVGGMIAVSEVTILTAVGDRTSVGVATAGAITNSILSSFSFHSLKS